MEPPFLMAAWELAPALVAGSTVVFKPSSAASLSVLELTRLIDEAGLLPAGVLDVINGSGDRSGEYLKTVDVDELAFTGPTEVGRGIGLAAAQRIIPVTLEPGARAPTSSSTTTRTGRSTASRWASCSTRARSARPGRGSSSGPSGPDRFMEVLGAAFSAVRVGDPLDPATQIQMRARINEKRLAKILVYVETGRSEGAEIVTGGSRYGSGPLARGAFMKSTLVLGRNDMRVAREEIFGPAGVITPFEDEDEVIAMADDSDHGLGGGVFSSDLNRALRVATRARTGRWVNQCNAFPAGAPFGGCKDSGIGRETRTMILDAYQQTKNILVSLGSGPVGLPYGD